MANRFGRCFLFGLRPRFWCFCLFSAVCFAVSAGETQVWLGDLRVVVLVVVVFSFVLLVSVLVHFVLQGSSLFLFPFWLKDFHLYV